jgi:hypothetical protein
MDANLVPAAAVAVLERDECDGAMAPMPAAMTEVGDGIVDLASLRTAGRATHKRVAGRPVRPADLRRRSGQGAKRTRRIDLTKHRF